jgi:hypothetical protein
MHEAIVKVAGFLYASDHQPNGAVDETLDLDDVRQSYVTVEMSENVRPDVIICGELIEHLTNPGWFLTRLRNQYPGVPKIITVPNAFCRQSRLKDGIETVNRDHVAWYSYITLTGLLAKCGYQVLDWAWYHGDPLTAEGLVVVCL